MENDIELLLDWLHKQPHLPQTDDVITVRSFYKISKRNVEKTKKYIDSYYTSRTAIFNMCDWENIETIFEQNVDMAATVLLPGRTDDGSIVLAFKVLHSYEKGYNPLMQIIRFMIIIDMWKHNDFGEADTFFGICDFSGTTINHMLSVDFSSLKSMVLSIKEIIKISIKGVHFANYPNIPLFMSIINILTSDKMKSRTKYHKSCDTIQEYIPKKILPKDFGGDGPTIEEINEQWRTPLFKNGKDRLFNQRFNVVDESKRPAESTITNDHFGLDGSFRKLDID